MNRHKLDPLLVGFFCVAVLCGTWSWAQEDEEQVNSELDAAIEKYKDSHLSNWTIDELARLKKTLPEVYPYVISEGWDTMDGFERFRVVAKPTLTFFGMEVKEIDDYMGKVDEFESKVLPESKSDVSLIFGLVGKSLLSQVGLVELSVEVQNSTFDAMSLAFSESHSDEMAKYRECLDRSVEALNDKIKLSFGDWMAFIENDTTKSTTFIEYAREQSKFAIDIAGTLIDASTDDRVCHEKLELN